MNLYIVDYGLAPDCRCLATVAAGDSHEALAIVTALPKCSAPRSNNAPWRYKEPRLATIEDRRIFDNQAVRCLGGVLGAKDKARLIAGLAGQQKISIIARDSDGSET